MSPSPPSHVQQQQNRFSNSSSPVSSSQLSEDDDDDEGAPRSDAATVGSTRSVIGDILESSFASSMDPEHPPARSEVLSHETVASRHGQLPPLYPAAADSTASSTTATSLFARAGMHPPENRAQVMPPQRVGGVNVLLPRAATTQTAEGRGSFEETSMQLGTHRSSSTDSHGLAMLPEASETGNSGAVATHTATKAGLGGGYQSGASSIKSCGSITGSEADERGESILTTVDMSAAEQVAAAQNNTDSEDDHDCGGSLDVETHSVATIRSLHSQLFQEEHDDHFTTTDDAASAATATASNPASPRASPMSDQQEQQLPQGMTSSQEDDRNEPLVDNTSMAGYARSRSPDRDESQGKSSRVRR